MNIKITHNWLLDYLETNSDPFEIQKFLSLSGPSVETVNKIKNDYVYDIEVTSNRVDTASVFGIAQECQAILPQFNKVGKLKKNPLKEYQFNNILFPKKPQYNLNVKIKDNKLCSRFTAIALSDIKIEPSPKFIQDRLLACDIRPINNVIDISNYLMIDLGQPVHIFDIDKISLQTFILRSSVKGESIVTLDGKKYLLKGEDIVIEDGKGRLVDLCGIMGGLNSAVDKNTKNILLFVQNYNKRNIRRTSMGLGCRSIASTYFEKGLDEERVEPTLVYGVKLLQKYAHGKVSSKLIDIYKNPYKRKKIEVDVKEIYRLMGIKIKEEKIKSILKNLGFKVNFKDKGLLSVKIPSFRDKDIVIKEDIIEEVVRIYGYHQLPNRLPSLVYIEQPKEIEIEFVLQQKIKYFLKALGFNEVLNYSLISKEQINLFGLKINDHLKLKNPISKDMEYLRITLIPSLFKNIEDNSGEVDKMQIFEIAKTYLPRKNNLPNEMFKLTLAVNSDFFHLKGILELLFDELNITKYKFVKSKNKIFSKAFQAEILINNEKIGEIGLVSSKISQNQNIFIAEIDFKGLIKYYNSVRGYKKISPYSVIKLDQNFDLSPTLTYEKIKTKSFRTSSLIKQIKVVDCFKNRVTVRYYFCSDKRNITEDEAKKELEKIKKNVNG